MLDGLNFMQRPEAPSPIARGWASKFCALADETSPGWFVAELIVRAVVDPRRTI
jgi:hypothetical protein